MNVTRERVSQGHYSVFCTPEGLYLTPYGALTEDVKEAMLYGMMNEPPQGFGRIQLLIKSKTVEEFILL